MVATQAEVAQASEGVGERNQDECAYTAFPFTPPGVPSNFCFTTGTAHDGGAPSCTPTDAAAAVLSRPPGYRVPKGPPRH